MSEEPKSIWKKSWTGRNAFWIWCALLTMTALLAVFLVALGKMDSPLGQNLGAGAVTGLGIIFLGLALIYAVIPFSRWLFWNHWRRIVFVIACFATLIALAYAEEDWRGWHAWNTFKREQMAKGEKFDLKDFAPPPVPADQNFALTPVVASCYEAILDKTGHEVVPRNTNVVNRLEMYLSWDYPDSVTTGYGDWERSVLTDLKPWQDYYRRLAATTNLFPVSPQPQTPAQDVLLALSKYDPTIEELREASKLPYSRFPIEYDKDNPAMILLPHLAAMKRCTLVLQQRTIAELQNGQSDKALADVKLMSYLNQSLRSEPVLISHLVRLAMTAITLQPVYEGLAEHRWSDAQLAELDAELSKLDYLADFEFSMRGERIFAISIIDYLRRTRHVQDFNFSYEDGGQSPGSTYNLGFHLAPASFFYQSELTIARMHQRWTLPMVDVEHRIVSPATVRKNKEAANRELNHGWPYNVLARMVFPAFESAAIRYARGQSSVDLARIAIALERYRLANGDYPASLDALAPRFIDKVPHDLINGQPLHYRRTGEGQFVLYSVGWNDRDDGGVVGLSKSGQVTDYKQGDLVWRYPAR